MSIDEKFETSRKMWAEPVDRSLLAAQRYSNITTSICTWPQRSPGETNNSAYCLDLRVARVWRVSISRITEQPRSVDGEGARRSPARPGLNPRRIPELPFVLSNLPLTAVISMVQAVPDVETRAPCRSHTCDPDDSYWGSANRFDKWQGADRDKPDLCSCELAKSDRWFQSVLRRYRQTVLGRA